MKFINYFLFSTLLLIGFLSAPVPSYSLTKPATDSPSTLRLKANKTSYSSYHNSLAWDFDLAEEIQHIRHGYASSPLLSMILFQNTDLADVGYKLCLADGWPPVQCFYSLGGPNIGYGLCMAAHKNKDDCELALGASNIGYGFCMASQRGNREACLPSLGGNNLGFALCYASKYTRDLASCNKLIGSVNTGAGLCLAAGRLESECEISLGGVNTGFGLCMINMDNSPLDCNLALGNYNIGYGLCKASKRSGDCGINSLGLNNLGYGLCMIAGIKQKYCNQAIGSLNVGYGICIASGRPESHCDNLLGGNNIGSGMCLAARMPDDSYIPRDYCYYAALDNENTGFGLCMAAGRPSHMNPNTNHYDHQANYDECKKGLGSDNTGFGLCMMNYDKTRDDCKYSRGETNIGLGLCMLAGGDFNDCYDAKGAPNLGMGLCMLHGRSENSCDEGLGGYNIGFGLCMSHHKNDVETCKIGRISDSGYFPSEFFYTQNGARLPIYKSTLNSSLSTKIELEFTPNYQHQHQSADIFVVAQVKVGSDYKYYQKVGNNFTPWSGELNTIIPAYTNIDLRGTMTGTIFEGNLSILKGQNINLFYGYRLNGTPANEIHYNNNQTITFKVN